MKYIYTAFCIFLFYSAFAQDEENMAADSLSNIRLEYELLDSAAVRRQLACRIPEKFSFNKKEDHIILIYSKKDRNLWIVVYLPFAARHISGSLINLDYRGEPELIIYGEIDEYGSGGGTGKKCMMIINFDNEPTQLFNVFYGCTEESFGDKLKDGEGAYYNIYERKITITSNVISVEPIDEKFLSTFSDCLLTQIPAGNYVMKKGKIIKQ
ncbi:MAG TPA: hypothetical protein VK796_07280 [Cytophaga sp.]|nr:hypothetical protein [Cytophaga sp.]